MISERQETPEFTPRDKVWLSFHPVSRVPLKKNSEFMPKHDGPYVIVTRRSPTIFDIADSNEPDKILGK